MNLRYKVIVMLPNAPYYEYGWSATKEGAEDLYNDAVKDFEGHDVRICFYDKGLQRWIFLRNGKR